MICTSDSFKNDIERVEISYTYFRQYCSIIIYYFKDIVCNKENTTYYLIKTLFIINNTFISCKQYLTNHTSIIFCDNLEKNANTPTITFKSKESTFLDLFFPPLLILLSRSDHFSLNLIFLDTIIISWWKLNVNINFPSLLLEKNCV